MTTEDFRPTHVVPQNGLPAWESPDVSRPTEPLDALLPVELVDRRGDWALIGCANGWSAWVDGRLLLSVPQGAPAAVQPPARTADPRPLLARVEESLSQYRRAAQDLADGRTDGEKFRRRTQGLRVGMVVEGESVWLYDAEHERWVYCDGVRLSAYAASSAPSAAASDSARQAPHEPARPASHEPTRVVPADGPGKAPAPEPTQVVTPQPDSGAPDAIGGSGAGPEPTQIVEPQRAEPDGDADRDGDRDRDGTATRVVRPGEPSAPDPSARPGEGK